MNWLAPALIDPPRGPDGKVQGPPPIGLRLALGLLGAVLGSFISNLDTRLTTFSLADLRGGVGYGADEATWVSVAYNIAEVAVVPITAWLASIISQRRAVAAAVALLTVAGAMCPWAATQGYSWLIGMRFAQGLGGGALIPLLLGILLRFVPLHQRIYGFTLYAFVTASTPLVSEWLAGVLTDAIGWQSIFYIGAALGPIILFLVLFGLPVEPMKPETFLGADYGGMLLLALWASLLTAALGQGQRLDWFSSPFIVSLFVAATCALAAFVVFEFSREAPLINLRLLTQRNLTGGLLTLFAFSFATLMTSNVLPQYGIQVRGFRELQVGSILVWAALAQLLVCILAPFLLRLLDVRLVLTIGLLTATLGARLATYIDSDWVRADILPSHLIQACGQPLIMVPLIVIATATLQPKDGIGGSTLFNVLRSLAGSVGGAVVGAILTVRERVHSNIIVDHLVIGAPSSVQAQAAGSLAGAVRRQATTMAVADAYGWIGVITLGAMVIPLVLNQTTLFRAPARPGK
jgi:DHA2 family multidrug resistance protein